MMIEPKTPKVRLGCDEADDELFIVNPSVQFRADDIESGEVVLSIPAQAKLRTLLSIPPGLTADEVEVARIEARLEEAKAAKVISRYEWVGECSPTYPFRYWVVPSSRRHHEEPLYGTTRLAAAQAALAYVETLEAKAEAKKLEAKAEAKKLPEPEAMSDAAKVNELIKSGWSITDCDGTSAVALHKLSPVGMPLVITLDCSGDLSAVLRRAREAATPS